MLGLYVNSPEVRMLYRNSNVIWGLCPLLLYWISRIWLKTHRGKMHDDPLVFALTDKVSLLIGGLAALVVLAGV
ncbi:MAG: hypothetical protein E6J87_12275 [Deltaproteobacteria bacterium]|nr:MAG: hypothetical protein E6J87_12275 [Deltaproteobacteria bacterium]